MVIRQRSKLLTSWLEVPPWLQVWHFIALFAFVTLSWTTLATLIFVRRTSILFNRRVVVVQWSEIGIVKTLTVPFDDIQEIETSPGRSSWLSRTDNTTLRLKDGNKLNLGTLKPADQQTLIERLAPALDPPNRTSQIRHSKDWNPA